MEKKEEEEEIKIRRIRRSRRIKGMWKRNIVNLTRGEEVRQKSRREAEFLCH